MAAYRPDARAVAEKVNGRGVKPSQGWYPMRGVCHGGDARPDGGSLSLMDADDGGLIPNCFKGCSYHAIMDALESATGWTLRQQRGNGGPAPTTSDSKGIRPIESQRTPTGATFVSRLWARTAAIPSLAAQPSHPAHRWIATKEEAGALWGTDALPQSIRWAAFRRGSDADGAIVLPFAPVSAWLSAAPETPAPTGLTIAALDSAGRPALDRPAEIGGLSKRSYGALKGCVGMLHRPDAMPPMRWAIVHVVEGMADGLAVLRDAPEEDAVMVCGGASNMAGLPVDGLDAWAEVRVVSDADADGRAAALRLACRLRIEGLRAVAVQPGEGKDYASAPCPEDSYCSSCASAPCQELAWCPAVRSSP